MREPRELSPGQTPARAAARALAKSRYPSGKALARIAYFEQQRGLDRTKTIEESVETVSFKAALARPKPPGRTAARPRIAKAYYSAAFRSKVKLTPSFPSSAGIPVWRELGPSLIPEGQTYGEGGNNKPPVSGRSVGIVIDPSDPRHLVLCSAGGGLWGSGDAGGTWSPLTDSQPTLSMGAIAAAPSAPNIIYAGTGEGDTRSPLGAGLLRSSDGGLTWTHVPSAVLVASEGIYDLAVDPADPLHLWIAAVAGLYESRDGGESVAQVRGGLTWDISIHPSKPKEVLVATEGGLLRSANGGSTWSKVTLAGLPAKVDRMEVCHAPSDAGIVYVAAARKRAFLWRRATAAGGFTTADVPAGMDVSQGWYDWCFAVSPRDPELLFWGAIELYRGRRAAGAIPWENISSRDVGDSIHPDQHHIAFDPVRPQTVYVCNDGGLFRSVDEGVSWVATNPGLRITEFEFLAHLESEDIWLVGGTQDNGTLGQVGSGTWNQVALGDGGDCAASESSGGARCYHSYYGMWIEKAPAIGGNAFKWTDASPPAPDDYAALFYPPMDVLGPLLAKGGQSIFVSANEGTAWSEVFLPTSTDPEPDIASALAIIAANTMLVGTVDGRLYRIKRGAGGWGTASVVELRSPRRAFLSDIAVPGSSDSVIWASCSVPGAGHVFRSSNGGSTWSDRSGDLPDIPVNAIVVDPADNRRLFAATDNGVFETTDAGTHWSDFSNGLPNVVVGDLILHVRRRTLRAGTRSRGAWEVGI